MTRKPLPILLVTALLLALPGAGAAAVARFDTHDVVLRSGQTFDARSGTNPFTGVSLSAQVTAPSGKIYTVRGFFDGDGDGRPKGNVFRIRIFADEHGTWRWTTSSSRADLHGKSGSFACAGTLPGFFRDGPVVVDPARPRVFTLREGRPVYLVGKFLDVAAPDPLQFTHTLLSEEIAETDREAMLARQRGMGVNKMNVYLANKGDYGHVSTTPWVGRDTSNDKTRFDLARWHLYERWVRRLRDEGIVAQLWFFADDSGFGDLADADRKRLIQYGMARLSGYVNTVFTLALEWQEGWTETEVSSHANHLHSHNPWDRLASVHGLTGDFAFPAASWADYLDIQAGNAADHAKVYALGLKHRELAAKPLIQEEHGLGEEDTRHRQNAWAALLSGAAGSGTGAFLKPLSTFVSTLRFERLQPAPALVVSGEAYAAADPGCFYLLYLYGGGSFLVDLSGASGALKAEWFDPRTGRFSPAPDVQGGGVRTIAPPDGQDWVLTLAGPPALPEEASFHSVPPCRVLDTRLERGLLGGPWPSAERRRLAVAGRCGIPAGAEAVAANVTAVLPTGRGHLTLWPTGGPFPGSSNLNFPAGTNRAGNAILPLGGDGTLLAQPFVSGEGALHVVLDVAGYFQ